MRRGKTENQWRAMGNIEKNNTNSTTLKANKHILFSQLDKTPPLFIDDKNHIQFTKSFTYLGSIINVDLNNTEEMVKRIKKTSKATGALNFI